MFREVYDGWFGIVVCYWSCWYGGSLLAW
jgi:hypothetical protein